MTKLFSRLTLATAALGALLVAPIASAQRRAPRHVPRITLASARATALARVPGRVRSSELERENHRWIYSFEIKTAHPGVEEVNVDADTGVIVNVEHERG